jgi:hypothetical protein
VVAVYKDDGSRGHHMNDYIPQEEMAKFMAKWAAPPPLPTPHNLWQSWRPAARALAA